jgi:hypothetical protein
MSEKTARQTHELLEGETGKGQLDCRGGLRSGVTISSITSIASIPTGLTLAGAARNSAEIVVNSKTVPVNQGVTFDYSGGTAGVNYLIKVLCVLSTGETKGFLLPLNRLEY